MKISEISITPVKAKEGLIGFASFVINDAFYMGSIAIYQKKNGSGIRLLYPKKGEIQCIHPITKTVGEQITQKIQTELQTLNCLEY